MIEFGRNNSHDDIPLTWRPLRISLNTKLDKRSASIVCSNGHYGILVDHDIDENGVVTPSVVCSEHGCNFHDYVKLVGWKESKGR